MSEDAVQQADLPKFSTRQRLIIFIASVSIVLGGGTWFYTMHQIEEFSATFGVSYPESQAQLEETRKVVAEKLKLLKETADNVQFTVESTRATKEEPSAFNKRVTIDKAPEMKVAQDFIKRRNAAEVVFSQACSSALSAGYNQEARENECKRYKVNQGD
jgi:hypothetical protein